jgi:hypothetical protein
MLKCIGFRFVDILLANKVAPHVKRKASRKQLTDAPEMKRLATGALRSIQKFPGLARISSGNLNANILPCDFDYRTVRHDNRYCRANVKF